MLGIACWASLHLAQPTSFYHKFISVGWDERSKAQLI